MNGKASRLSSLVKECDDLDSRDEHGRTALYSAIVHNQYDCVEILLKLGANVKEGGRQAQELYYTEVQSSAATVPCAGANARRFNDPVGSVFHVACVVGNLEILTLLLHHEGYADEKDGDGFTALMEAAQHGHAAIVDLLIGMGADVNAESLIGWTSLALAAHYGQESVVEKLLNHGADCEVNGGPHRKTPLAYASKQGHARIVNRLLAAGANIEARNSSDRTALMLAAEHDRQAVVNLLIRWEADLEATDIYGSTALSLATRNGNFAIVEILQAGKLDGVARYGNG